MANRRGGPQKARTIRSVTAGGTVTYQAGDSRPLANVPRQDLRALAVRMGKSGSAQRTNEQLRADILGAAGSGGWSNGTPDVPEAPKPTPAPKPDTDAWKPVKLTCPNGHTTTVPADSVDYYRSRGCPTCGKAYVDPNELPKPEAAPKPDRSGPEYAEDVKAAVKRILESEAAHSVLPALVSAVHAGRHVYLAGPPGTGKSELAAQAARALGRDFHPFSCDPGMTRATLFGFIDAGGTYHGTPLRAAVENGGVFLLDEMDNGNASLLAALNSLLANGSVTFPDGTIHKHQDFVLVATANTWGTGPTAKFVGRMGLDPATLDRLVRLSVDVDPKLEDRLAEAIDVTHGPNVLAAVRRLRKNVESARIDLLVSPRTTINSTALVAAGWTLRDALVATCLAPVVESERNALLEGVV